MEPAANFHTLEMRQLALIDPVVRTVMATEHAARACDLSLCLLFAADRGPETVSAARQVSIYLAHVECRVPVSTICGLFQRDRRTVRYSCHRVEDRRDDPVFDAWLGQLADDVRRNLALVTASGTPKSSFTSDSALHSLGNGPNVWAHA